jgi:hypothetical protein
MISGTQSTDFQSYIDSVRTVHSKHSLFDKAIQYKVADLTRSYGWCTKQQLLGYSRCVQNFPVTEKQINKYYVQFPATVQGRLTRSTFSGESTLSTFPAKIGSKVATDFVSYQDKGNGVKGVQLFVDHYTLYVNAVFTSTSGTAATLGEALSKVRGIYGSYGHSMQVIQTDSLSAYKSTTYDKVRESQSIGINNSAPHEHQQNFVERMVRVMEEQVSTMVAAAPWVPKKLITFCIVLWIWLWNLGEGTMPGISRYEQFTHQRPSATHLGLSGTFGDCYAVHSPKELRGGHFAKDHGRLVTYLCPDPNSKDCHIFYSYDTDTVLHSRSFHRLPGIPPSWPMAPTLVTPIRDDNGNLWDFSLGKTGYNVWQQGATVEAVRMDTGGISLVHTDLDIDKVSGKYISNLNNDIHISNNLQSSFRLGETGGEPISLGSGDADSLGLGGGQLGLDRVADSLGLGGGQLGLDRIADSLGLGGGQLGLDRVADSLGLGDGQLGLDRVADSLGSGGGQLSLGSGDEHSLGSGGGGDPSTTNSTHINNRSSNETINAVTDCNYSYSSASPESLQYVVFPENSINRRCIERSIESGVIRFVSAPTELEIQTTRAGLIRDSLKSNKRGNYNADSPSLLKALQSQDAEEWVKAINIEYATLELEMTWEAVVSIPKGKSWIPSHMILVRQKYADGTIKKYKARLVANGNRQQLGSYNECSSPTARESSVKLFYAKAASMGRIVRTFDVKAAYLKSDLDEEIYMMLPKQNKDSKPEFVRLLKSLYGLKQAGKLWFENIKKVLLADGFDQASGDECIFTKYDSLNNVDIDVCLYVDDLLISSSAYHCIDLLWKTLSSAYGTVNETTHTETHLGIKWERLPSQDIKISQPGYIMHIVEELELVPCQRDIVTPYRHHTALPIELIHSDKHTDLLRKMVGLINHAATHTRPDVLFINGILATKVVTATKKDIDDAEYVIQYLLFTKTLGLTFKHCVGYQLVAFLDASHLTHRDGKGHSGLCYRLGFQRSACFAFTSKKQSLVTRSSSESEIYVIDKGCHDIEWFRRMLEFLRCPQDGPTIIYEDNASSIFLAASTAKWSDKSKHINWRYHYALQAIKEKTARLEHIGTDHQIADILTKEIYERKKFCYLRSLLMNCSNTHTGV